MRLAVFLIILLTPVALSAQYKPVEVIKKKSDNEIVIPYEKYILPNGLTVVIHEDHSDPVVQVDVTYHVGSAREEIGKSGFAHFFEHMMFQGSDHVGDDQHFKHVTESGGTLNGSTNRDRTNYYETVPANELEKMLWLEADRMGFFLDAVTQKKFEIQRSTVKNERGQNYDNRPYGLVGEVTARNLYPYGHPYSWLTIGYIEDLNKVDLQDLKNFFLRWYGPNNATLTIGGDVHPQSVMRMVEKYFGSIPAGPEVKPVAVTPPVLQKDRHVTLVDNYARLPLIAITYPTVPNYHPDMMPLACLAQLLGQGKTSSFYQDIVKKKLAVNASAFSALYELSGEFSIQATPVTGVPLETLYTRIKNSIDSFEVKGISDNDIAKFKGAYEAQLINGLQSVSGKVFQLAAFQTFTGNPGMIGKLLEMNRAVSKEDVMRVYQKYIKGKPSVIVSVVTKDNPGNIAAAPSYTIDSTLTFKPDYGYDGLKYSKGKDNFDRSVMPAAGPNPVLKTPAFWTKTLKNGIRVIGSESNELPLVSLTVKLPGGHIMQQADTSKAGLSRITGVMLNEDTQKRTAEEMQVELQKLGASINVGSSFDGITFNVLALKKNLAPTLALLEERILMPKFTEEAFSRIRQQTLESFKIRKAQPTNIANNVFAKLNYGDGHILSVDESGTETSVQRLTVEDVRDFYSNILSAYTTEVVVVGNIPQKEALAKIKFLEKLPAKQIAAPQLASAPSIEKTRIFIVDVPGAAQTEFRVGKVTGIKYDATGEFYKAGLMNYLLGGAFNSRFNMNLREDKGWTYGARSNVSGDKYTGTFAFSSSIRKDATDSALVEVLKEARLYASENISADELRFMRSAISQREALRYETLPQKGGFIGRILEYDLPPDFIAQQVRILNAITSDDLRKLASDWLTLSSMNILLVGDKDKILPGLKSFGYDIIELDRNGKPKVTVP
jgi:zinc protease